jgi:bacterioferritin
MAGINSEIVNHLNKVLSDKLASINRYFLHARILKHMDFMELADHEYKESIQQMKHADKLIERILSIGGTPDLQEYGKIAIGNTVEEILKSDLAVEQASRDQLNLAIDKAISANDKGTSELLNSILESKDERIAFISSQLKLIDTSSLHKYLQVQS